MALRIVEALAIILTALYLIPGGAHLLELPHKIAMPQADYLVVQQIYRGWALFGVVIFAVIIVDAVLIYMLRGQTFAFAAAIIGLALIVVTLVTFFIFIYPVNGATADWTLAPENWQDLRARWEYTHAVNSVLNVLSLIAMTIAALSSKG